MAEKNDLLSLLHEKIPELSKSHKKIAYYLLENYDKVHFKTSQTFSAAVGVSESTIIRFIRELGFKRYHDFQDALEALMRLHLTTVQRIGAVSSSLNEQHILESVMKKDAECIAWTLNNLNRQSFEDAVFHILKAKHIYIVAGRSASALASFLGYYFNYMFESVKVVNDTSAGNMFDALHWVHEGDVVIGISFPRYSQKIVRVIQYARTQQAHIIAVTDNEKAPISRYAAQCLVAGSGMASIVDSLVAPLSLLNALIAALSIKKRAELSQSLLKLETIWQETNVYEMAEQRQEGR